MPGGCHRRTPVGCRRNCFGQRGPNLQSPLVADSFARNVPNLESVPPVKTDWIQFLGLRACPTDESQTTARGCALEESSKPAASGRWWQSIYASTHYACQSRPIPPAHDEYSIAHSVARGGRSMKPMPTLRCLVATQQKPGEDAIVRFIQHGTVIVHRRLAQHRFQFAQIVLQRLMVLLHD